MDHWPESGPSPPLEVTSHPKGIRLHQSLSPCTAVSSTAVPRSAPSYPPIVSEGRRRRTPLWRSARGCTERKISGFFFCFLLTSRLFVITLRWLDGWCIVLWHSEWKIRDVLTGQSREKSTRGRVGLWLFSSSLLAHALVESRPPGSKQRLLLVPDNWIVSLGVWTAYRFIKNGHLMPTTIQYYYIMRALSPPADIQYNCRERLIIIWRILTFCFCLTRGTKTTMWFCQNKLLNHFCFAHRSQIVVL